MIDSARPLDRLLLRAHQFFSTFLAHAEKEGSVLLGCPLAFPEPRMTLAARSALEPELPVEAALVRVGAAGVSGALLFLIPFKQALALSSTLLVMTPAMARRKIAEREVTPMDADALAEIGNQLCGFLNRVLEGQDRAEIHLQHAGTQLYPAGGLPPLREFAYLHGRAGLALRGFDEGRLHCLIPPAAGGALLGVEVPPEEIEAAVSQPGVAAAAPPAPSRVVALLLYEDDDERQAIEKTLEAQDITVLALPSEADPFEILRARRVDCVVIESGRPLAGVLACDRLRKTFGLKDIPFLVCAGHWTDVELRKAVQVGVRDVLAKPLDPKRLADRLRRLLDGPAVPVMAAGARR